MKTSKLFATSKEQPCSQPRELTSTKVAENNPYKLYQSRHTRLSSIECSFLRGKNYKSKTRRNEKSLDSQRSSKKPTLAVAKRDRSLNSTK